MTTSTVLPPCPTEDRTATCHNPIKLACADPWMFYHDGFFYLMGTRGDRITVSKARTVAELETIAEIQLWSDTNPARCHNMWAPEAHLLDNRWYVYYAADDGQNINHRMHVLESAGTDPLGPYAYKAELDTGGWAIDGTVCRKRDGSLYFFWSQHGTGENCLEPQHVYVARMSNPWTIESGKVLVAAPAYDWEMHGRPTNEGPQVLQRNSTTHIIYSASHFTTPNYALGRITVDESADFLDPNTWVRAKHPTPVFQPHAAAGVYGPGHASFFTSPDGNEHWIAYHAVADCDGTHGENRTTRIQRFTWHADDTPCFGVPVALDMPLVPPGEDYKARWQEADPSDWMAAETAM